MVFGIHSNFTYDRSSRWQVFFKIGGFKKGCQSCNFFKKRFQYRFFPVKLATFLRTPFLRNTSGGCFWYDFETHDMVLFAGLLILISFQFKLYMILMNLVKVNHQIYCVQEKIPKIKRLIHA